MSSGDDLAVLLELVGMFLLCLLGVVAARHVIWRWRSARSSSTAAPARYPTLLGSLLLAIAILVPLGMAMRDQRDGPSMHRENSMALPITFDTTTAQRLAIELRARAVTDEPWQRAIAYSGSQIDKDEARRLLEAIFETETIPEDPTGASATVRVTLLQRQVGSLEFEQGQINLAESWIYFAEWDTCLWMLGGGQPPELRRRAVRQLELTLSAATMNLQRDNLDSFRAQAKRTLEEMLTGETDAALSRELRTVINRIPASIR